eukprot:Lithocolla_globosa_v1_NODE_1010_length_2958_cov_12.883913.p1 type:complete len:493 gc:universal NODE_1010_length_2958_cov_12.883913:116-1594(+)
MTLRLALLAMVVVAERFTEEVGMLFDNWVRENSIYTQHVVLKDLGIGHGGVGVFASAEIPEDTVVLQIPLSSMVSILHVKEEEDTATLFQEYPLVDAETMAVFLINERNKAEDSFYYPFFSTFPTDYTTPLYFTQDEWELFERDLPLYARVAQTRKDEVERGYKEVSQNIFNNFPTIFKNEIDFSLQDWIWGLSTFWNHVVAVPVKNKSTNKWKSYNCFIPFFHFLNTGFKDEINLKCETNEESTDMVCRTTQKVENGKELLRDYMQNGENVRYLMDYGFAFELNPADKVQLPLPDYGAVKYKERKLELLPLLQQNILKQFTDQTNQYKNLILEWDLNPSEQDGLMTVLRLFYLTGQGLERYPQKELLDRLSTAQRFSRKNEYKVLDVLIEHLTVHYLRYSASMEEDDERLSELYIEDDPIKNDFHGNVRIRAILTARVAEKSLVFSTINILKQKREELKEETPEEAKKKMSETASPPVIRIPRESMKRDEI